MGGPSGRHPAKNQAVSSLSVHRRPEGAAMLAITKFRLMVGVTPSGSIPSTMDSATSARRRTTQDFRLLRSVSHAPGP